MNARTSIALLLLATLGLPQDAARAPSAQATRGTIRKTYARDGTFVPARPAEIRLDLAAYGGELRLAEVAGHGSPVNAGDVVARFDTEGIDEKLARDALALTRSEMELRQAEERGRMAEQAAAETLERAERDAVRAAKRLEGYRKHERGFEEESERLSVQGSEDRIEDQQDELVQLEKMYAEDELVDATEEIVLKRQRRNFARAKAFFDLGERRRTYDKEYYDEWKEQDREMDARHRAGALERTRQDQALDAAKRQAELDKRRFDLEKERKALADLRKDREQFVVRAPQRGIVLHGAADKAPWTDRLEPGSTARNRTVFLTVTDPRALKVTLDVEEKRIFDVENGMAVEIEPTAMPDRKSMGRLSVEPLPGKGGLFRADVELAEAGLEIRPGMTCKARIVLAEERDVVLVPANAVEEREGGAFVRCAKTAEGPFEERRVVAGTNDGKQVAIREGIAEGEFVALRTP